jgi:hypothetical protein
MSGGCQSVVKAAAHAPANASIKTIELTSSAYFSYNFAKEHSVFCSRFIGIYLSNKYL